MRRLDRSEVKRGMYLTSDAGGACRGVFVEPPRGYTRVRDLPPEPLEDDKLEQLTAEREALKQRLVDIQQRVAAIRKKPS
jgi:hypothetical protein